MNRKTTIALSTFLLLLLFYYSLPYFNGSNRYFNYLNYIFYGNRLDVSCTEQLDKNDILIVFENETALIQNRDCERPQRVIGQKRSYALMRDTIFKYGKHVQDIPYDYGPQRLAVYYNEVFIGELAHWQTNDYHVHDYTVRLVKNEDTIVLREEISGPDIINPVQR